MNKMNSNKTDIYAEELKNYFDRWEKAYNYGSAEPFWADGMHLNIIRNHIKDIKKKIENEIGFDDRFSYPDIYHKETPPELDNNYMAIPLRILDRGIQLVEMFENNADYQYIVNNIDKVFPKGQETEASQTLSIPLIPTLQLRNYRKVIESGNIVEIRRKFYFMNVEEQLKDIKDIADKFREHEIYISSKNELRDEDLIGLNISDAKKKLGYWYVLEGQHLNSNVGIYQFKRAPGHHVEIHTENNIVTSVRGLTKVPIEEQIEKARHKNRSADFSFDNNEKYKNSFERE